jgi:hypothetical protein
LNPFYGWSQMSVAARALRVGAAVIVAAFAIWTLSPLFYNRVVNEPFAAGAAPAMADQPTAAAMAEDGAMADKPAGDTMAEPTAAAMAGDGAMADKPADAMAEKPADAMAEPTAVAMADKPTDAMAEKPADAMAEPTADTMAEKPADATAEPTADTMAEKPADAMAEPTADTMADEPTATPAPAGPLTLVQGSFVSGRTPGHHASGSATIYQLEDGTRVLRLENFDTTNGPDVFVTLHTAGNPDEDAGEHLQLAPLKGNQGNQNYELPVDLDLSQYHSVVIWCRSFNVVFGYASLAN